MVLGKSNRNNDVKVERFSTGLFTVLFQLLYNPVIAVILLSQSFGRADKRFFEFAGITSFFDLPP